MFHPVGSQPPNVYWRRRLLVLGAAVIVVVLLGVTISALSSGGSATPSGQGSPVADAGTGSTSSSDSSTLAPSPQPPTSRTQPSGSSTRSTPSSGSPTGSPSGTAVVKACRSANLSIAAAVGQSTYQVGQSPTVELEVTNVGPAPCAQDLADKQVLLTVYNGVSRVWGSHDCQTQPGTDVRTLAVDTPVRISVGWSGETSQPNCAGTRQRVGAGTYTLYASLSGKTGKAAEFTIG